jgi:hypothetical protein
MFVVIGTEIVLETVAPGRLAPTPSGTANAVLLE